MSYIEANFIKKHDKDDFSLWTVELDDRDYQSLIDNSVWITGKKEQVLQFLPTISNPPETMLHLFWTDLNDATILSSQVSANFMERYSKRGHEVRGSMSQIIEEALKEDDVILSLSMGEAQTVREALELELRNCDDKKVEKTLSDVYDRLEEAASFPEPFTIESDTEEDVEL